MENEPQTKPIERLRIDSLKIESYKRIDSLELNFPLPLMEFDPDVTVIGSKNGGGKCIGLLLLGAISSNEQYEALLSTFGLSVKTGKKRVTIVGTISKNKKTLNVHLDARGKESFSHIVEKGDVGFRTSTTVQERLVEFMKSLLGHSTEPLLAPSLLYFNSYRKIQETNLELSVISSDDRSTSLTSILKFEMLRSMLGRAEMFEDFPKETYEQNLEMLNGLLNRFAQVRLDKLRSLPNNALELRVVPNGGKSSFSFDGLSSGQKEIISTLFLIWLYSKNTSNIVLIDEPELHLNAEWHADFIYQLHKLAPNNQYIIASHSEDIFRSVEAGQRFILKP